MVVTTRKGNACENGTKENPRTGVRPQVKQTALLASLIYIGQAQAEETKHIKRGAQNEPLLFGSVCPHAWRVYYLLSK